MKSAPANEKPAREAVATESVRRLNLGCGNDVRSGWVNLDRAALPGVDFVHDLNVLPLPFADASFAHVCAQDVLEHVEYIPLLRELHRILKPAGTLEIQVPHFTSADNYIDPTHVKRFSIRTFEFFVRDGGTAREYYFDFAFSAIASRRITFLRGALFWNYLVEPLVNLGDTVRKLFELTFVSRIFPAQNIRIILVK